MGEKNEDEKSSVLSSPKEETPIRNIVCLKRKEDMKRFEETEECFILEFDPSESLPLSKLSLDNKNNHDDDDAADLSIVAEKGPVACRDYPHSRHMCLKFPFSSTPHESYCEMCYCYACDSAAPCKYWTQHCGADGGDYWKDQRDMKKLGKESD
ncbi:RPM1 interacting protein 13-like [Gastrolobium bilobum]|uniref:RPM1 interacting protein 13-like n=1 Tax=Gastrolobium bilobum TaxID=150636 RepID=UPI002AAFF02F|nr:RPM1 interacting protein 13-like [Gastrolobium bilobum]